jgi:hypothetical protein
MGFFASIFLDFNLPNATSWFYFSLLLAVALFFRFTRFFSMRNWDVVTLFLLVPGLLLITEARTPVPESGNHIALRVAQTLAVTGSDQAIAGSGWMGVSTLTRASLPVLLPQERLRWFGYLWLLCGSGYFLIRCLFDLSLVRRPALSPNLNPSGLTWLGAALFICLVVVAIQKPPNLPEVVGKRSVAVEETQRRAEELLIDSAFWVERTSAILCHLAIVLGLAFIGWRHFQDAHAGVAAATFYLLLPYTAFHVEQVHHVLPTALLIWAVAAYRRPTLAGILLGLASGTGYFPLLLFPVWLSFYWRRSTARFVCGFALAGGLCLAAIATALWMNGDLTGRIYSAFSLSEWRPWNDLDPNVEGFWTGISWAAFYRLPVFIAYLAFVGATLFWPSPKNLAHMLALSAAVIIGIQFWFTDQGGVYVLWYLPLLLLLAFRPNLADREAPCLPADFRWLAWLRRRLGHLRAWLLKLPEPAVHVH